MALQSNFTRLLLDAKRRARISGRPLSTREASGIAEGFSATAADRGIQERRIEQSDEAAETQRDQFAQQLAFQKQREEELKRRADEASQQQEKASVASGVGAAAGFGAGLLFDSIDPLIGTVVGSKLGEAISSWF